MPRILSLSTEATADSRKLSLDPKYEVQFTNFTEQALFLFFYLFYFFYFLLLSVNWETAPLPRVKLQLRGLIPLISPPQTGKYK
jgi:hypothetical protein